MSHLGTKRYHICPIMSHYCLDCVIAPLFQTHGSKAKKHKGSSSVQFVSVLSPFVSFTPRSRMPSTDNFIQSLADKKKVLDVNPYLDVSDQNGLELSYFLLRDSVDRTLPRQTSSRHRKAQQHLKNAYLIAKVLFVLVAATASITDLALLEHKELFPRLEQWWSDNLPTEKFESHATKLLEDLETKRDKGELSSNRGDIEDQQVYTDY